MIIVLCCIGVAAAACGVGHYLRARERRTYLPDYCLRDERAYYVVDRRQVRLSLVCCVIAACLFVLALVLAIVRARGA